MHAAIAAILAINAAINVWVEPNTARLYPDSVPGKGTVREPRLHAACGERESFQLCVRASKKSHGKVAIEAEPPAGGMPAPEIRRVGYLDVADESKSAPAALVPDPLLDYEPRELPPDETLVFWITYSIPRDAKAGVHKASITVVPEVGPKKRINLAIVVFDFALPEKPSLRSLFPLDRAAVRNVYNIPDTDLDAWRPIYESLAKQRISYSVWDGGDLVSFNNPDAPDVSALKAHLECAVESARMNTVDIGPGLKGIAAFPQTTAIDNKSVRAYLVAVNDWLAEKSWLNRAVIEPCAFPARAGWNGARRELFHVKEADPRVVRILSGPIHPFFEEYMEICAVPPRLFDPHADRRMFDGISLIDAPAFIVDTAKASSSAPDDASPYAADPQDACDGSVFTSWTSAEPPTPEKPQWFEISLRQAVKTKHLKIIWRNGFEPLDFVTYIKQRDAFVPLRDIPWEPYPPDVPYGQSWIEAELKRPITITGLRFEFSQSMAGRPIGITEIMPTQPDDDPPKRIDPVEPWVLLEKNQFPSLLAGAHPIEPRMIPWVSFNSVAAGYLCRNLNHWPDTWSDVAANQPPVWRDPDRGEGYIFYPGKNALMPSIRSELLREGMEDYEYLVALEAMVVKNKVSDPQVAQLAKRLPYPPQMQAGALDQFDRNLRKFRTKIGWTLDALARKGVQ